MTWKIQGNANIEGIVPVSGSKNAVLPIIAGSILAGEKVTLRNVPALSDVFNLLSILEDLGVESTFDTKANVLEIQPLGLINSTISVDKASKLRASFLVAGSLLGRFSEVAFPFPGGCSIGSRPIDLHLKAFNILGAENTTKNGCVNLKGELKANDIFLDFPSVGATENAILTAVSIEGRTRIQNGAEEPEIKDLVNFLNHLGADIKLESPKTWVIEGGKPLSGGDYTVMYDRIETGTWLALSAMTNGRVKVQNVDEESTFNILQKFKESGFNVIVENGVYSIVKEEEKAILFQTGPHPSFPTDMQPLMLTVATVSEGMHIGLETIFSNRYLYLAELMKMGGNNQIIDDKMAVIKGVNGLQGAQVKATDLRAGASLVIAAIVAEGDTIIQDTYHIERGYEKIFDKLHNIGINIQEI